MRVADGGEWIMREDGRRSSHRNSTMKPKGPLRVGILLGAALLLAQVSGFGALSIKSHYSPLNNDRPKRSSTKFIILHTTEGPGKGSLQKVYRRGEAHYLVDIGGNIYRVIHRSRIAYHAGTSMWNNLKNLDRYSIGIEIVGYHDRVLTNAQYKAVRELLRQLQKIYTISDEKVLTHSMVAYGPSNRWHKGPHRGRKRCAMFMGNESVRRKLGLTRKPGYDPDIKAGRLIQADPYLGKVLYGGAGSNVASSSSSRIPSAAGVITKNRSAWDIAKQKYKSNNTVYVFPGGKRLKGNQIRDWTSIPSGTQVIL